MGNIIDREWADVAKRYRTMRPVLQDWDLERVSVLDQLVERGEKTAATLAATLNVCILGKAGVGKSTLLNALLDRSTAILPQGGVGPLTAQAVVLEHSPEAYFEVKYHGRNKLNSLLLALHRYSTTIDPGAGHPQTALKGIEQDVDEEDRQELEFARSVETDLPKGSSSSKIDGFVRQASLIIHGDQFKKDIDVRYLVDGLRLCLGLGLAYGSHIESEDRARIELAQAALGSRTAPGKRSAPVVRRETTSSPTFKKDLKHHAAGSLAPLVASLKVGWPSLILSSGITLVDLPGVGVANDEYRQVTQRHVRSARAIGLVVDRAGLDADSAELLRSTGFLNSLLLDSGDVEAEPIHLFVAVVKLDLTADDRLVEILDDGESATWVDCFDESRRKVIELVKGQLSQELGRIADDSAERSRDEVRALVDRLLSVVEIHPVAPREYRQLYSGDTHKISRPEESYVPQLGEYLQRAAQSRRERIEGMLATQTRDFAEALSTAVRLLEEQAVDSERADSDVAALREDFQRFAEPKARELATRNGAFRSFLREVVPAKIETAVHEVTDDTRKDLHKHIRTYRNYHWATLRAAIRRGGTFSGARFVDLPAELALKFEEPVAVVWAKVILALIRKRTRELGEDRVRIGADIVQWSKEQGARVPSRVSQLLEDDLRTDTRRLASVGEDAVDELKTRVRTRLHEKLEKRIRKACQKFVAAGHADGAGVMLRMQAFFEGELTDEVLQEAREVALAIFRENYTEVQGEIETALKQLPNPISRANDLVVERQAISIVAQDRKRKERLQAALLTLRNLGVE